MSTLAEAIAAVRTALPTEAPRIVQTMAQTSLALVTSRVQNQGLGVPYSQNPVPVYLFADKALNAGGKAYVKQQQKQAKGLGTWAGFRGAQGLPTGSVNLTYSGRMFRALTTVYVGSSGTVYSAQITSADDETARLVGYNTLRYGDFLAPTASEQATVQQVGQGELEKIVSQYFK